EPAATRKPATGLSVVTALHEAHDEVASAADCREDLSAFEVGVVSTLEDLSCLLLPAHELGGDGEAVQVLRQLGALKLLICFRPIVLVVGAAASGESRRGAHRLRR